MTRILVTSTAKACPWARQCITSVAAQGYHRFDHVYIAADKETYAIAESVPVARKPVVLWSEATVLQNVYSLWQREPDDTVIVWLDGDDWLAHPSVLSIVAEVYAAPNVWLTYGSFTFSGAAPFKHEWFGTRYPWFADVRNEPWRASHLKTFRAGLAKRVQAVHLKLPDGAWLDTCTDRAFMYPMLEMAGESYRVITEPLSVYNTEASYIYRQQSQAEREAREKHELEQLGYIQGLPRYKPLKERPW